MPGTLARKRARLVSTWRVRHTDTADTADAIAAEVGSDAVSVRLADGRVVSFPLAWSPRLLYARPEELADVEVSPLGLHWPQLDEDLSLAGILAGRPSGESAASVEDWQALMDRRRDLAAHGETPEPFAPVLPLPEWWDDEPADEPAAP